MKLLITLILIAPVIFFISCGRSDKQPAAPVIQTNKFNFACLRYDSAALEYRLDSIHNRGIELQFILRDAGNNNTSFQLISYAFDTLRDYNNSWIPDTLHIIADSVPVNFTDKITIGNNEVTREQLLNVVRDDQGKRFAYDYVMFVPVVEGVFNHVVYMLKPVKNKQVVPGSKMQMSSPMPPTRVWDF
ncbi:MAG: hypothetical protein JNK79_04285 [Chitinophagaceae bacterium]|nr:hypothetical protein [Chitinophagaceae bacterium]